MVMDIICFAGYQREQHHNDGSVGKSYNNNMMCVCIKLPSKTNMSSRFVLSVPSRVCLVNVFNFLRKK